MSMKSKSVVVTPKFFDEATIRFLEKSDLSVTVRDFPEGKNDATATEAELIAVL